MVYQYLQWLPLIVAFITIFLVYCIKSYFRLALPDDFPEEDAEKMKSFLKYIKFGKSVSYLTDKLGLVHRITMIRKLGGYLEESIPEDPDVKVSDITLDGVDARLYVPTKSENVSRAVIYIHGGGWVIGSIDEMDHVTKRMAKTGFIVASIAYRLAPEYPFPLPFDDCVKATKAFITRAKEFNVNSKLIAVAGDSAGGNLAAAVALKLRDERFKPGLKAQVLLYPCLQAFDFKTSSYERNQSDIYIDREIMTSMWLYYAVGHNKDANVAMINGHISPKLKKDTKLLDYTDMNKLPPKYNALTSKGKNNQSDAAGNEKIWETYEPIITNPYFAPLMADDVSGLPPTYLSTCEYDVLRDDGLLFVSRLKSANVQVMHQHYDKALHAPLDIPDMEYADNLLNDICQYLDKHV